METYSEKRATLDFVKSLGLATANNSETESTLRLEAKIKNGSQIFKFGITENQGTAQITETRLKLNDKFVVTSIKFGIIARQTAIPGIEVIQTYPNPQVFAAVTTSGSEFTPEHLEAFYNGTLTYTNGTKIEIDNLDLERFRSVDTLIKTSATTASSSNKDMGSALMVPTLKLSGNGSAALELALKSVNGLKVENTNAGYENYLVLLLRGYKIPA